MNSEKAIKPLPFRPKTGATAAAAARGEISGVGPVEAEPPNKKRKLTEEEARADERKKILKLLQDQGVTLPEAVVNHPAAPAPASAAPRGLTPGQALRKQELLASLAEVKAIAAGERAEEKRLKAELLAAEKALEALGARQEQTKANYKSVVAELKSLS